MIARHWRSGLWVLVNLAVSAGLIAWIASRFDFATAASRLAGMHHARHSSVKRKDRPLDD